MAEWDKEKEIFFYFLWKASILFVIQGQVQQNFAKLEMFHFYYNTMTAEAVNGSYKTEIPSLFTKPRYLSIKQTFNYSFD